MVEHSIKSLQISLGECAGRSFQLQTLHECVVTRPREIAASNEQLLLGGKYIAVDANPDLIPNLIALGGFCSR